MNLELKIETGESCGFKINDMTPYPQKGNFTKSDTVSIILLGLCKSGSEKPLYQEPQVDIHNLDTIEMFVPTIFDGHFKLNYIVLPNEQWYNTHKEDSSEFTEGVYYYKDGKIFKEDLEQSLSDLEYLLSFLESDEYCLDNTTLSAVRRDYISICNLKKCFIYICTKIFEQKIFKRCAYKGDIDKQLIYNRDLLWMTINVISYLTQFSQLDEAERIIELISNCNGICKQEYRSSSEWGCGCS